ncbi:MAG: hypothetical protein UZ15_CFX003001017 [Chloroflexi bacterium OLB15]|nr:MAG: hypothetical protein UZ15_CFX003001017 [Chloroflexi bacterium OLB15]
MITLLVHIQNQESVKMDVEDLPGPGDNNIVGKNPREKTDKEVGWVEDGVTTVIIPMWRITLIEVLPSLEEETEFPLPFRND